MKTTYCRNLDLTDFAAMMRGYNMSPFTSSTYVSGVRKILHLAGYSECTLLALVDDPPSPEQINQAYDALTEADKAKLRPAWAAFTRWLETNYNVALYNPFPRGCRTYLPRH